jgi:hypothetical protein
MTCGAASFYARTTGGFPKLMGKESRKKWQCSFFYAKNLLADSDHVNLPGYVPGGPEERGNWKVNLKCPGLDMDLILKRVVDLQGDGGTKAPDLLLAFISARVSPLQHRSHKICFLGSNKDPTRNSSKELSAEQVSWRANKIVDV